MYKIFQLTQTLLSIVFGGGGGGIFIKMYHSDKASVVGFQVLTVVLLRIQVWGDVTLDCWVTGSWGFKVNCAFICMGPTALEEFLSGLLGPVDVDTTIVWNAENHSPSDRVISPKAWTLKGSVIIAMVLQSDLGWFYTSAQNAAVETPHKTHGNANRIFKWGNIQKLAFESRQALLTP